MMPSGFLAPGAALVLAAVSLATVPTASADQGVDYFLQQLRTTNQKWYWPAQEGYILSVGYGVCDDWAADISFPHETARLAAAKQWTQPNARFFVALSTRALCPEWYLEKIPPSERPLTDSGH
jgi:hypothetical protein